MDSQSKVMTVSYGTFSCTLEGFDDPFTTMQLVAEYFRKLAAEDRYFGGEPIQPDADTLHRIARDANPNKVDAEVSENSIVLRQATIVDAPPVAPAIKEPEPEAFPVFASRRSAPRKVTPVKPAPVADKPKDSFVEPTQFSSRRGALEPGAQEPEKPAAEMLRDDDPVEETLATPITADVKDAVEKIAAAMAEDIAAEPTRVKRAPEKRPETDIQQEEEALERLLETTNSKLSTPSHARRSNALERLKAAVAATEAERHLRGGTKTSRPKVQDLSVDPEKFRSEMRAVRSSHEENMKISRPVLNREAGSRRRGSVATLILASDQQVAPADAPAEGLKKKPDGDVTTENTRQKPSLEIVRPKPERPAQPVGFAAFATKSGASTLHQLLEASAAYLAIVEDQPRFSHERLIANLDGYLQENDVSPEATSRSLNRLLRDGRILRVKADRYTLSKSARHGYQAKIAS